MNPSTNLFEMECRDDTVILIAKADLSEFEYETLEAEATEAMSLLSTGEHKNIVVDLSGTDYCGSTALGLFLKLWKQTRRDDGAMAFCGLSDNEREIFATMRLELLWPIFEKREQALAAVRK